MKNSYKTNLYLALIHYPVINKNRETITSAVTNLDLHDIARASRTFGVKTFYVVTPLKDQKELVEKIVSHWITGMGAEYNPARQSALELIQIKDTIEDVIDDIQTKEQVKPKTIATCAKNRPDTLKYSRLREMLYKEKTPYLLNFGTAWGLSEEFISNSDYVLDPVKGHTDYNHLSVRSAVSIILDRLSGQ